jgi:hypothetical protein
MTQEQIIERIGQADSEQLHDLLSFEIPYRATYGNHDGLVSLEGWDIFICDFTFSYAKSELARRTDLDDPFLDGTPGFAVSRQFRCGADPDF